MAPAWLSQQVVDLKLYLPVLNSIAKVILNLPTIVGPESKQCLIVQGDPIRYRRAS